MENRGFAGMFHHEHIHSIISFFQEVLLTSVLYIYISIYVYISMYKYVCINIYIYIYLFIYLCAKRNSAELQNKEKLAFGLPKSYFFSPGIWLS